MCLHKLNDIDPKVGYKVTDENGNCLCFPEFLAKYKVGETIISSRCSQGIEPYEFDDNRVYEGIHVFNNLKDAKRMNGMRKRRIFLVKGYGFVAGGVDDYDRDSTVYMSVDVLEEVC